jgi:hypothetical protein
MAAPGEPQLDLPESSHIRPAIEALQALRGHDSECQAPDILHQPGKKRLVGVNLALGLPSQHFRGQPDVEGMIPQAMQCNAREVSSQRNREKDFSRGIASDVRYAPRDAANRLARTIDGRIRRLNDSACQNRIFGSD